MNYPGQLTVRNKSVLVIDESIDVLALLRELLQGERYAVTTSTVAPGTWNQIAALQPDLLLIDLAVENDLGWTLLERLKREPLSWEIPVIVLSTDPDLLRRAEQQADRYAERRFFRKPFDIDELMTAVGELAGAAEPDFPPIDRLAAAR